MQEETQVVSLRLSQGLIDALDAEAARQRDAHPGPHISRASVIRQAVIEFVQRPAKGQAKRGAR